MDQGTAEKKLSGQVALVTGAAHRIGRAIAMRLASEGAQVVVHYGHSKEDASATVADIRKAGREASCTQAELTHLKEIRRMFEEVEGRYGRLDVLVNNAGRFYTNSARRGGHGKRVGRFAGFERQGAVLLRAAGCAAAQPERPGPNRKFCVARWTVGLAQVHGLLRFESRK